MSLFEDRRDSGTLTSTVFRPQVDETYFKGLQDTKPDVKFLASFGGTSTPPELFSHLTMGNKRRAAFVQNLIQYVTSYGFAGIDIAWLYPTTADKVYLLPSKARNSLKEHLINLILLGWLHELAERTT